MPSDLRVVFDTNTLVSAFLLPKSIPRQALDSAVAAGRLLLSPATATAWDGMRDVGSKAH